MAQKHEDFTSALLLDGHIMLFITPYDGSHLFFSRTEASKFLCISSTWWEYLVLIHDKSCSTLHTMFDMENFFLNLYKMVPSELYTCWLQFTIDYVTMEYVERQQNYLSTNFHFMQILIKTFFCVILFYVHVLYM